MTRPSRWVTVTQAPLQGCRQAAIGRRAVQVQGVPDTAEPGRVAPVAPPRRPPRGGRSAPRRGWRRSSPDRSERAPSAAGPRPKGSPGRLRRISEWPRWRLVFRPYVMIQRRERYRTILHDGPSRRRPHHRRGGGRPRRPHPAGPAPAHRPAGGGGAGGEPGDRGRRVPGSRAGAGWRSVPGAPAPRSPPGHLSTPGSPRGLARASAISPWATPTPACSRSGAARWPACPAGRRRTAPALVEPDLADLARGAPQRRRRRRLPPHRGQRCGRRHRVGAGQPTSGRAMLWPSRIPSTHPSSTCCGRCRCGRCQCGWTPGACSPTTWTRPSGAGRGRW